MYIKPVVITDAVSGLGGIRREALVARLCEVEINLVSTKERTNGLMYQNVKRVANRDVKSVVSQTTFGLEQMVTFGLIATRGYFLGPNAHGTSE